MASPASNLSENNHDASLGPTMQLPADTLVSDDIDDPNQLITLSELALRVWPALEPTTGSSDPDSLFLLALARTVERHRMPLSPLIVTVASLSNPITSTVCLTAKYVAKASDEVADPLAQSDKKLVYCREYPSPLSPRARMAVCALISRDPLIQPLLASLLDAAKRSEHFPVLTLLESQLLPLYNYLWWFEPESFAKLSRPYYAATLPIYASLAWPPLERKRQLNKLYTLYGREIPQMQERLLDDAMLGLADICRALDSGDESGSGGRFFFSGEQQPALVDLELYAVLAPLVRMKWKSTALRMQFYSVHYNRFQRIVRYVDAVHAYCFENAPFGGGIAPAAALTSDSATSIEQKNPSALRRASLFVQEHFVFIAAVSAVNVWLLWRSGRLERWAQQVPFLLAALTAATGGSSVEAASLASGGPVEKEVLSLYKQHRMGAPISPKSTHPGESEDDLHDAA